MGLTGGLCLYFDVSQALQKEKGRKAALGNQGSPFNSRQMSVSVPTSRTGQPVVRPAPFWWHMWPDSWVAKEMDG